MSTPILTISVEPALRTPGGKTLGFSRLAVPTDDGSIDIKCYLNVAPDRFLTTTEFARELQRVLRITVPEITVKVAVQRQPKEEPPRLLPADTEENSDE